jgi:hypothetical protein
MIEFVLSILPYQQPQEASFLPVRAAYIIAAAHPTPLSTFTAPVGQLSWHAPHSIQLPGRTRDTTPFALSKTACGQTAEQNLQLLHNSRLNCRVLVL